MPIAVNGVCPPSPSPGQDIASNASTPSSAAGAVPGHVVDSRGLGLPPSHPQWSSETTKCKLILVVFPCSVCLFVCFYLLGLSSALILI